MENNERFKDIKIIDINDGPPQKPCKTAERIAPKKCAELFGEEAGGENYEWVLTTFYSMREVLKLHSCWFDKYGNLCSEHGHLAPSFFKYLGTRVHVKIGCGFSMPKSDWLKRKHFL